MYQMPGCNYGSNPMYMYAMQNDRDEEHMYRMYPESCRVIMPYAEEAIARRERMGQLPDNAYPSQHVYDEMVEEVYEQCKDYFDGDPGQKSRQYDGRFFRDLIGILLISTLLRRRRRRRRRFFFGY